MNPTNVGTTRAVGAECSLLVIVLFAACLGCKSTPKNPFAEQATPQQSSDATSADLAPTGPNVTASNTMTALEAESSDLSHMGTGVALAAVGLGKGITSAAKDAASRVRLAAANTLARESQEAERVATRALATAQQAADETVNEAQLLAKDSLATIERLRSTEVAERRAAAARLAAQATSGVLPPEAVAQLAQLIKAENDPVVWRSALAAVATSTHQAAEEMAYSALTNASAEVRREACNYLAAHGDPRHAEVLLRAMTDPQAAVRLAAIRALGSVGTLGDPRPLVGLLDAGDKKQRVEAAVALARLRVQRGTAALERLAMDTDFEIRLRAAQGMGEIADASYLPALVAMLGDRPEVQQAAMVSLVRIAGSDVATDESGAMLSIDERARRWQHWYAQHPAVAARIVDGTGSRR